MRILEHSGAFPRGLERAVVEARHQRRVVRAVQALARPARRHRGEGERRGGSTKHFWVVVEEPSSHRDAAGQPPLGRS